MRKHSYLYIHTRTKIHNAYVSTLHKLSKKTATFKFFKTMLQMFVLLIFFVGEKEIYSCFTLCTISLSIIWTYSSTVRLIVVENTWLEYFIQIKIRALVVHKRAPCGYNAYTWNLQNRLVHDETTTILDYLFYKLFFGGGGGMRRGGSFKMQHRWSITFSGCTSKKKYRIDLFLAVVYMIMSYLFLFFFNTNIKVFLQRKTRPCNESFSTYSL